MGFFGQLWDGMKTVGKHFWDTTKKIVGGGITGATAGAALGPEGAIGGGVVGGLVGLYRGIRSIFDHSSHPSQPVDGTGPSAKEILNHFVSGPGASAMNYLSEAAQSAIGPKAKVFMDALRGGASSLHGALRAAGVSPGDPAGTIVDGALQGLINRDPVARHLPFTSPGLRQLVAETSGGTIASDIAPRVMQTAQSSVAAAHRLVGGGQSMPAGGTAFSGV